MLICIKRHRPLFLVAVTSLASSCFSEKFTRLTGVVPDHETSDHRISTYIRHGPASPLHMAHGQRGFCFCYLTINRSAPALQFWEVQSEAADVAYKTKMGLQREPLSINHSTPRSVSGQSCSTVGHQGPCERLLPVDVNQLLTAPSLWPSEKGETRVLALIRMNLLVCSS